MARKKKSKRIHDSKRTLKNVQSAIVVALKLLKPVVERKLPKAHFNYEPK